MKEDKEFFAQSVHKYIVYQDIALTLKKYQNRIINELKLRNLPNDYFKNKTIIDIGTGFQAIIASLMGAKFVYHLDQSHEQIQWTEKYCKKNKIDNIKSIQCDITKEIPIDDNAIDIVLVFGIWHHLVTPSNFMSALIPKLNLEGSSIWLRVYHAGTWSRWLTENLRKISKRTTLDDVEAIANIRYSDSSSNQYKGDMLDDLFAPVWQAFHPEQFNIHTVSSYVNFQNWEYDFNDNDENFRVDFNINNDNIDKFKKFSFPDNGIIQKDFVFNEEHVLVNKIQNIFNNFEDIIGYDNLSDKLIILYEMVRSKPIFNLYTQTYLKDNNVDFSKRLKILLYLLESFKKEKNCI